MAKILGIRDNTPHPSGAVNKNGVDSVSGGGGNVASGCIIMLTGGSIPSGWVLCDGSEYLQTTYSTLFSVIGTAYNSHPTLGAPSSGNFRVPDLRDLFPLAMNPSGSSGTTTLGIYNTSGWNHTHNVGAHAHTLGSHTHNLNAHTHTVNSHSHTMAHTHSIPSHTHTYSSHPHNVPGHSHGHTLGVNISHNHDISARQIFQVSTNLNPPRGGMAATNNT
jgi:microcystin-dependent protein